MTPSPSPAKKKVPAHLTVSLPGRPGAPSSGSAPEEPSPLTIKLPRDGGWVPTYGSVFRVTEVTETEVVLVMVRQP